MIITRNAIFKDAAWPNVLAIAYALSGYAVGSVLLFSSLFELNVLGVLLLTHALVIAAYLIHEFAHLTVFRELKLNNVFGGVMAWITGACYARFDDLRRKHLRHHADRADVITFDYRTFLRLRPAWVRRLVYAMEWFHVPAIELIMHGFVIALPFFSPYHHAQRQRVMLMLIVRIGLFGLMSWYSPRAAVLYVLSYVLFLSVLRFIDAFQHTYDAYPILESGMMPDIPRRDRDYEYKNTYSNLISARNRWLNLLVLNFVYHNAHHSKASVPWHRLPILHDELYGSEEPQVLTARELLHTFHRNRMARVLGDDYGTVGSGPDRTEHFIGAVGVSFLTAV